MGYGEIYARWKADPEGFWMDAAGAIDWVRRPSRALNADRAPLYEWFTDGVANTCWNAVDRHVLAGRGNQLAIIHDSPVTHLKKGITYRELQARVASLAGALRAKGVEKGDRVIIYMPMIPEALEAMLACARLGAIHSVVFGGFAANELAVRIDDCTPKAIIAASCGIEPNRVVHYKPLLDAAIDMARHKPDFCVIFQREQEVARLVEGRDHAWHTFQYGVEPADCVPVEGNHPAYILYTSGTTGAPKGVVRPTGGHMVALMWTMRAIYDCGPGDVFWAAATWAGSWGTATSAMAPSGGLHHGGLRGQAGGHARCGHLLARGQREQGEGLFTAPTALRAIKRDDPEGELVADYNMRTLKTLYLAGERADPDTILWAQRHLKVPVIDHWWQTETGWAIAANPMGIEPLPVKIGSPSVAMPGFDVQVLDEGGHPVAPGTLGAIAVKLPLPPARCPRCGTRRSGSGSPTSTTSPAITRRAMRAMSTRTAIFTSWRARMT